jgi:hypothetical protein
MFPSPQAIGDFSHVEGVSTATTASGTAAHAEGFSTTASNAVAHAEGIRTTASGIASHAEGVDTTSSGFASHAEGLSTMAIGDSSHAEGEGSIANGLRSHAEGEGTIASGNAGAHAEGQQTNASGDSSHAEGFQTAASGLSSHAEGQSTIASGDFGAHAEGQQTNASGIASHAEGQLTNAIGTSSHAEGFQTTASGPSSHAEGIITIASGNAGAHAEGQQTSASGDSSHAEGFQTAASGVSSHAEGQSTIASGNFGAHAEGQSTTASGDASHAEGVSTSASGFASHAEGDNTIAAHTGSHIMGQFGSTEEPFSWFIANGTSTATPGLGAKWLASDGNMYVDGTFVPGGADYAEMFETTDGDPIDVGFFVTFDGASDKIRKATSQDSYILGISSATPSVLGNSGEMRWKDKFVTDEWGRIQQHEVTIPAQIDEEGKVITPEYKEIQWKVNPDWDPTRGYVSRLKRPEWVPIGLLGQILVRDDGTCKAGGYCKQNNKGIATASENGYRVMKRTGPNQVLVLVNSLSSKNELDLVVKLEKLAKLKEQGFLTDEEFQIQKQKLLNS